MTIFKACDIRGVAGRDLDEAAVRTVAQAAGSLFTGRRIVIGGDVRNSTLLIKRIVIEEMAASGCTVLDIGSVATPMFNFAVDRLQAFGGVMVTASHNPPEYNGLKFALADRVITEQDIKKLASLAAQGAVMRADGCVEKCDIEAAYLQATAAKARRGSLKVVVDAGNGAASRFAPTLFRSLGYEVVPLFCTPDGSFPNRAPNPALAENLVKLGRAVCSNGAALGVAFDGDGDRAGFVDEHGCVADNDDIMVLLARDCLRQGAGAVVYDAKCSMVVPEAIQAAGGRPVMARAGHTFSRAAFLREQALLAGEISGHFFFRELGYDDGMYAALRVCELIAAHGSLAAQVRAIPDYILTPDIRVPYSPDDKEEVLAAAAAKLAAYRPNLIDGVRLEFADGWGMIRASVTEPLFTLRFEAKTAARLQAIEAILLAALPAELRADIANIITAAAAAAGKRCV